MAADLFYIVSELNGLVLEVEKASDADRAKLVTNYYHGGKHQLFKFKPNGEIAVASTGKGVNVEGAALQGHNIIQWPPCTAKNQLWRIHKDGSIKCFETNLCLDIANGNKAPGSKVHAWVFADGLNQKWRLVNKFD